MPVLAPDHNLLCVAVLSRLKVLLISSSATFAAVKNKKEVKTKLAKQDFDFLYDHKKGGLYFNENGADKGFGDGGIIAILKGAPDLTINNLDFT